MTNSVALLGKGGVGYRGGGIDLDLGEGGLSYMSCGLVVLLFSVLYFQCYYYRAMLLFLMF